MGFAIMTDSNSEILWEWEDTYGVRTMYMPYTLDNQEHAYDLGRKTDISEFYQKMREGAVPVTAQRNPQEFTDWFRPVLEQGNDIIYIAFSSNLSGTFNCAELAIKDMLSEFPERRIAHIDTLAISLAEGLLVWEALKMQRRGDDFDTIVDWVESNKMRMNAYFTVDDLAYLKRGGRVSSAAAAMGTILDVKPILHISPDGLLVPVEKVKGRRKAVRTILSKLEEQEVQTGFPIAILHADCENDAFYLRDYIHQNYGTEDILLRQIGPVIGSHVGPGALAVVFMGKQR